MHHLTDKYTRIRQLGTNVDVIIALKIYILAHSCSTLSICCFRSFSWLAHFCVVVVCDCRQSRLSRDSLATSFFFFRLSMTSSAHFLSISIFSSFRFASAAAASASARAFSTSSKAFSASTSSLSVGISAAGSRRPQQIPRCQVV